MSLPDARASFHLEPQWRLQAEPMTLGSPPSPPTGGSYLPGFLMGDPTAAASGTAPLGTYRTTPVVSHVHNASLNSTSGSYHFMRHYGGHANYHQSPSGGSLGNTPAAALQDRSRRQAPPTTGLWSSPQTGPGRSGPPVSALNDSAPHIRHSTPHRGPTSALESRMAPPATGLFASPGALPPGRNPATPVHRMFKEPQRSTVFSPAQVDPFYTQGDSLRHDDVLDETWITIFGYPSSASSYILQQFSQCGTIEKHIISNDGNWMHLKFETKLQAKKALSKNGKVFSDNIMVGVQPCIDKKVMSSPKTRQAVDNLTSSFQQQNRLGSPSNLNQSNRAPLANSSHLMNVPGGLAGGNVTVAPDMSLNMSQRNMANSSMRSLTAGYAGPNLMENEESQNNSGFLTKAINYMFGW